MDIHCIGCRKCVVLCNVNMKESLIKSLICCGLLHHLLMRWMRLIYGFLCLAIVAGCQTTCDNVSESSATSNHVSVAAVRYMASVGGVGAETVEVVLRNGSGNGLQGLS